MALSQVAQKFEQLIGHNDNAVTAQDMSNPAQAGEAGKFGHPTEKMLALTWQGKNKVELQEVPRPIIVEPRDAIIKITGTTVCGSDLHLLHGSVLQMKKGDILGHEFCGIVEELGPGVDGTKLKKGDRVVASFQFACGDCFYCKQKLSSQCERTNSNKTEAEMYGGNTAMMAGYSHLTGGAAGGQGEWTRVPFAEINLLKLPDSVPDEKGLYLSDVLCTSWNCVVDTGVKQGDTVAIWGSGSIGQCACDFAFMLGASRVIMIDSNWRLDFMKKHYPKCEVLDYSKLPKGMSVTQKLKEMTGGRGPDVALECAAGEYAKGWAHYFEMLTGLETDTSEILNEMITSVRSFGRCGVTGLYVGFTNHFNIGALMERGIRLIGNGQAPVHLYWEKLLKMIEDGEIDPLKMVTHRIRLEDIATAYMDFNNRLEGMQKIFVETKFSAPACEGSPSLTHLSDK